MLITPEHKYHPDAYFQVLKKFDVFLYLAMKNHIGTLPWLDKCKILVYEGHGAENEREFKITKLK